MTTFEYTTKYMSNVVITKKPLVELPIIIAYNKFNQNIEISSKTFQLKIKTNLYNFVEMFFFIFHDH